MPSDDKLPKPLPDDPEKLDKIVDSYLKQPATPQNKINQIKDTI